MTTRVVTCHFQLNLQHLLFYNIVVNGAFIILLLIMRSQTVFLGLNIFTFWLDKNAENLNKNIKKYACLCGGKKSFPATKWVMLIITATYSAITDATQINELPTFAEQWPNCWQCCYCIMIKTFYSFFLKKKLSFVIV